MSLYKYLLVIINIVALSIMFHMVIDVNQNENSFKQQPLPPKNIEAHVIESELNIDTSSQVHSYQTSPCPPNQNLTTPSHDGSVVQVPYLNSNYNVRKVLERHTVEIKKAFSSHPSHGVKGKVSLEEYMQFLARRNQCHGKPIFLTMARVSSPLYWQLIENFFYTMNYFGHLECAVMACVSDDVCMSKCAAQDFPCFDFRYENPDAVTFEQVAAVKLRHVGLALALGVDVLLLDLDVGFMRDPMTLFEGFLEHGDIQVRTQMDIGWAMDKKQGMTWFTFPRANFGIFLVKACPLSVKVFNRAWATYQKLPQDKKAKVASDQSVMQGALSHGAWRLNYNFSYFYPGFLPDTHPRKVVFTTTLLLHKVENYNSNGIRFELGGTAAQEEIGHAVAVHATCYEKTTKMDALKAANAFWDEEYYTPTKRTLTKPLMLHSTTTALLEEIHALAYLAVRSNRSLIIPNILIGVGLDLPGGKKSHLPHFDYRLNAKNTKESRSYPRSFSGDLSNKPMSHCAAMGKNLYWPAFRTVFSKLTTEELEILEPGFYFKIEEQLHLNTPESEVLTWSIGASSKRNPENKLSNLLDDVLARDSSPRLVLDLVDPDTTSVEPGVGRPWDILHWAAHSASSWGGPIVDKSKGYWPVPPLPPLALPQSPKSSLPLFKTAKLVSDGLTLCEQFLRPPQGNRSCFNKCN